MTATLAARTDSTERRYQEPGWITRNAMNRPVRWLTRRGVSIWGSRVLEVPGRRTGRLQQVPVNLLQVDGHPYLVSPRGETQWVRNVRAAGGRLVLVLGRSRVAHVASEVADEHKAPILRAYLRRWKAEVGAFFDGVDDSSSDEELLAIAHLHPVFALHDA